MTQALSIITGASRGLGLALAQRLHVAGHHVLNLSRQRGTDLPEGVDWWPADLSEPIAVAQRLEDWLRRAGPAAFASATLVNNAAVINEPGPLSDAPLDELAAAARINLEAPLLLSAAFLRATADWPVPRKLLLISSGLGRRGMAGSAMYCATKAGLDNLARALALEEAERGAQGAKVVSLAPGIIDTDMQVQLRSASPERFSARAVFADFKEQGKLDSPAAAAAKLQAYLERADFGSNPVASINDP